MDEQQSSSSEQKSNLNPLLIVVVLIIVGAVGVMLWLGNKKAPTDQTKVESTQTQTQQPTAPVATEGAMEKTDTKEQAITVEGGSFYFKPNEIKVKKGEKVKITFTNAGGMHDFVIDEFNVKSEMLQDGATTTVEFTPDKAGTFEFYCSVGNHRQMGMKGNLIVE